MHNTRKRKQKQKDAILFCGHIGGKVVTCDPHACNKLDLQDYCKMKYNAMTSRGQSGSTTRRH